MDPGLSFLSNHGSDFSVASWSRGEKYMFAAVAVVVVSLVTLCGIVATNQKSPQQATPQGVAERTMQRAK
jgi:hypothetical protein